MEWIRVSELSCWLLVEQSAQISYMIERVSENFNFVKSFFGGNHFLNNFCQFEEKGNYFQKNA
jgi:hypothetical protein